MSKRYHILFEPIEKCTLPIISIEAAGAMRSDGKLIEEEEGDVPVFFYHGQPFQAQEYLGRITEPERIVAWWTTDSEEESGAPAAYHLLLKPVGGRPLPVISITADHGGADGRFDPLKDIPTLFWKDWRRGKVAGRLLRPDDVLAWWRTLPQSSA